MIALEVLMLLYLGNEEWIYVSLNDTSWNCKRNNDDGSSEDPNDSLQELCDSATVE